ncbi:MAG: pyruvate kinase [Verrucomicrobiales bacterium]|jgi:pyruvate kinase|nr:pyruvate kinase [Verrucomicrobiales bacterium]
MNHTKIVATLGPASNSPDVIHKLIQAGMNVARLNFSHGSHGSHAQTIANLRSIAQELDKPITILQDLQGPKVRVGQLANDELTLTEGKSVTLIPEAEFNGQPATIPLDYAYAAEEAQPGMQILLADGLFELQIIEVRGNALVCRVVEGGTLKSRKGVNFPNLNLRLPSLTDKDLDDLQFGLQQDIDWISLSFVRNADDVRSLKKILAEQKIFKPVIAKIEKPQAIEHLDEILGEVNGIMVARGDLGVELSPEKVPMLQKHIIEKCKQRGLPVITATQMLESMIHEPRPTRAEASDVANAIIDGTDAVMLSGESAVGQFPVRAVEMMGRIAREVEAAIDFKTYPPTGKTELHALCKAANLIADTINPKYIVVHTTSGYTVQCIAAERPKPPVIALTTDSHVYHALNLFWGIQPMLIDETTDSFEGLAQVAENTLRKRKLVTTGDTILVIGGVPPGHARGANFVKTHQVK